MYWVKYVKFNGKYWRSTVRFFHKRVNAVKFCDSVERTVLEKYNIPGY